MSVIGLFWYCHSILPFFSLTCNLLFEIYMILSGLFLQLTGVNRPVALSHANAVLNRIDLLSEVLFVLFFLIFSSS